MYEYNYFKYKREESCHLPLINKSLVCLCFTDCLETKQMAPMQSKLVLGTFTVRLIVSGWNCGCGAL